MKNIILILFAMIAFPMAGIGQNINFRSIDAKTKHLLGAQFGADYGSYYGITYGYVTRVLDHPVIIGTEITLPFGSNALDDFRGVIGIQTELWNQNNWSVAVKPSLSMRRYESALARIYNVGAELAFTFGYLKPRWGVVGVAAYEGSFASNLEHYKLREYYPDIKDGWYGYAGGNFRFGIKGNVKIKSFNTFLSVGKLYGQNFKDNPTFPFYAEVSVTKQIGR